MAIFYYLLSFDIQDEKNKFIHYYHGATLRMLSNFYQTENGINHLQEEGPASQLIQFCEYSVKSCYPKTVQGASIVL